MRHRVVMVLFVVNRTGDETDGPPRRDLADEHDAATTLAIDAAQAQAMRTSRRNQRYLPGVALPAALRILDSSFGKLSDIDLHADSKSLPGFNRLASQADLVVIATPMSALRSMARATRSLPCRPCPCMCLASRLAR